MKKSYQYHFVTTWRIKASIESVWQIIYDQKLWPAWWKGVLKADTFKEGDQNDIGKIVDYSWRSILPYTLNFKMISKKIQRPTLMEGNAFGELEGEGKWILEEKNGVTTATCYWNVNTSKKWMNAFSFILKPLFEWNHNVIMKWGAKGLAKKLNATLIEY